MLEQLTHLAVKKGSVTNGGQSAAFLRQELGCFFVSSHFCGDFFTRHRVFASFTQFAWFTWFLLEPTDCFSFSLARDGTLWLFYCFFMDRLYHQTRISAKRLNKLSLQLIIIPLTYFKRNINFLTFFSSPTPLKPKEQCQNQKLATSNQVFLDFFRSAITISFLNELQSEYFVID